MECVLQECPTRVSYKTVSREFRRRVSVMQDVPQECTRVSHKAFRMECVLQECPTRVSYKTVSREFRRRVSVMQDVPQECTRVSHKAFRMECVLQECPTRVSPKRVSKMVLSVCIRVPSVDWTHEFALVSIDEDEPRATGHLPGTAGHEWSVRSGGQSRSCPACQ